MVTSFFKHDSNARNDEKLINVRMRHKAAGYGIYFMILERLRDETEHKSVKDYNMIAFDLREDASIIKSVIEDFGLFDFTDDGKFFYSERLCSELKDLDIAREQKSKAGKLGMARRWGKLNEEKRTENQQNNNSVITELQKSDNYIREDNIRKEISSPLPSPLSREVEDEEDEDSLVVINYFSSYDRVIGFIGTLAGRADSEKDSMAIMRFLTDEQHQADCVEFFKAWPKNLPLYELRQKMEGMERKEQIRPIPYADWVTVSWIRNSMTANGQKKVIESIRRGGADKWEQIIGLVRTCKANTKIEKPENYILKCITDN